VSVGGLVAILIGSIVGGTLQYWFWGGAILLDVIAAAVGGQAEGWNLHPDHFGERHGLFVIIALGETLIVAAGRVTDVSWTGILIAVAILAIAITCSLWWSYFPRAKPVLDQALELIRGAEQTRVARDVYSLIHFPMLCGIIAYAFAVEETAAHPGQPLPFEARVALAVGLVLFVGGMAVAIWRSTGHLLLPRLILTVGTAIAVVAVSEASGLLNLVIAFVGILAIAVVEQRGDRLVELRPQEQSQ
jgi:low temperature requirement protein LtrA